MRRFDAGEWLLLLVVAVLVGVTFWVLARMVWQAPEVRDVPATVTPTRAVTVLPTATTFVFSAPTREVVVMDQLPIRATSTRVLPTSTPTPTVTPVPPTPDRPPVQRG